MAGIKCECGYTNPPGTELCQRCGKPFTEGTGLLNMRYEGAALRSRQKRKTLIDRVWIFLASVKVGVGLLVITLIVSMLGTVYPQQMYIPSTADPYEYYPQQYGWGGYLYVTLGLHNLYSSWWYIALLILIGVSITVSSIDRGIPLYRALKRQRVKRHIQFLKRQRISGHAAVKNPQRLLAEAKSILTSMRYKVKEEDGALLGEKNRFSRWGGYVVHLGLIVFLLGALFRIFPGFTLDEYVWVRDGETVPVPGTEGRFYIKSEGFTLKMHGEDLAGESEVGEPSLIPEDFITEAVLYENVSETPGAPQLKKVKEHTIRVNHPLRHEGLSFYQSDYVINEFSSFTFNLLDKETEEVLGELTVDLYEPAEEYDLGDGYRVYLLEYYPDFELDENQEPQTKSPIPNNPAFIFRVVTPDNQTGETSLVLIGQTIEAPGKENRYALKIDDIDFQNASGLMVRKERSLSVIFVGLGIVMLGLVISFYWQHRRIWLQVEGDQIWVAGHTTKNWFGFKQEVIKLIGRLNLPIDAETLDKEESKA